MEARARSLRFFVSTNLISSGTTAREKVNLRTPDVMAAVQEQVESHYRSDIVEKIRRAGGIISVGNTTVRLAKQFGFCYGVERAIGHYGLRPELLDTRAIILLNKGDVDHALRDLERVVNEAPTPTRLFHLARAHERLKNTTSALAMLRQAADMGLTPLADQQPNVDLGERSHRSRHGTLIVNQSCGWTRPRTVPQPPWAEAAVA